MSHSHYDAGLLGFRSAVSLTSEGADFHEYNFLSKSGEGVLALATRDDVQAAGGDYFFTSEDDYITSYPSNYEYYFLLEGDDYILIFGGNDFNITQTFYGWTGHDTLKYFGEDDKSVTFVTADLREGELSYIYSGYELDKKMADFEEYKFVAQDWQDLYVYGTNSADEIQVYASDTNVAKVYGYAGDDILRGSNDGHDYFHGGNGDDTLYGNTGINTFNGGKGSDYIYGGWESYATVMMNDHFGGGIRLYFTNVDSDIAKIEFKDDLYNLTFDIDTAQKIDVFKGTNNADTFFGNDLVHDFFGEKGDDVFYGGAGEESFIGGSGDDTINGGKGNDSLQGGTGQDTFAFAANFGRDDVLDFTVDGTNEDFLDVSGLGIGSFAELQDVATLSQSGTTTLIEMKDGSGSIVLNNVNLDQLTESEFIFA